jgi:hypothetical protein
MPQDPKKVEPKVGAYEKPQRAGGTGTIVTVVVIILAVLLILWLFTDIL